MIRKESQMEAEIREAILTGGGKQHATENSGEGDLQFLAVILLF